MRPLSKKTMEPDRDGGEYFSGSTDEAIKQLAKGSGLVFVGQILGRFCRFGLQVTLGRLLGVAGYGMYALAISVLELASRFSQLGLANGMVRFVAVDRADRNLPRLKGTVLAGIGLGGVMSLAAAAGLAFIAPWIAVRFFHARELIWPVRFSAVALPFYTLLVLTMAALRGYQRMDRFVLVSIARDIANVPLAIAFVMLGLGVAGAIGGFGLASLAAFLFGAFLLWQTFPKTDTAVRPEWQIQRLLRVSLPLYLAGISYILLTRTDLIMLGYFASSEEVGAYRAAVALAHFVVFGLNAVSTAFAPIISDCYHRGALSELHRMYKTAARWTLLMGLVVALPLVLFPGEMLSVYGPRFAHASWSLMILVGFQVVLAMGGPSLFMLQMSGRQDFVLANNVFTLVLNLGLNIWWIPRWGIMGAALATGLSLAVTHILALVQTYWLLRMHPFHWDNVRLMLPLAAALGIFGLARGLGLSWGYGLPLVMGAFGVCFLAVGRNRDDRLIVAAIWKKVKGRVI